ncbi:MAG: phage tail tape measure protein [Chloroflexi bacterium]|nr:phage tail tape measure protein [Chloroflexota bacterium]
MAIGAVGGRDVGKIRIRLVADGDGLSRSIDDELGKAERKSSGKIGAFAAKLGLAAGAAVGAGVAKSVIDFGGFERQMNEVFTLLPGISQKAMDQMTGQVKNFSKEFGVLPDKVVPALYQALSAGVPKDNVFEFLETAQKAAKGGVTDLTTAVDGISSVVNAYGAAVVSATQASDLMFTTVRLGKTNFAELSQSMFNVTPTAAALGVKFSDLTAALAAMTLQGVPTSVATTQLRQLFVELSKEGTNTSKVFEKIAGKSFKDFIAGGGNTQKALQLLEKHARSSGLGINDLFGSVEAGAAALSLTGSGTEKFTEALKGMEGSAGATEGAFKQMETGIGPIWDRLRARASVALLDMGQKVVEFGNVLFTGKTKDDQPTSIERAALRIRDVVGPVIERVKANWPQIQETIASVANFIRDNFIPILATLGTVLAGIAIAKAVAGFVALKAAITGAGGALAFIGGPVTLVIAGIAALVAGIVVAYQRFEGFRNVVDGVARFLRDQFANVVNWTRENWGQISEAVTHAVNVVRGVIEAFVTVVGAVWRTWGDEIRNIAKTAWDQIRLIVETAVNIVRNTIQVVLAIINGDWGRAWDGIKGILSAAWEYIKGTIGNALAYVGQIVEAALSGLRALWESTWNWVRDYVGGIWEALKSLVGQGVAAIVDFFLAGVEWILRGAARMFSWVPGVGDKLRDAASAFERFRDETNAALSGIRDKTVRINLSPYASDAEVQKSTGTAVRSKYATGGWVVPGSGNGDSVPAWLTPGEFVFSRPAVKSLGYTYLDTLHRQARGYATGGLVRPEAMIPPLGPVMDHLNNIISRAALDIGAQYVAIVEGPGGGGGPRGPGAGRGGLTAAATALLDAVLSRFPGQRFTSGYRSPEENARVGGAPNSDHMYGRAIDISPGSNAVASFGRGWPGIKQVIWQSAGHYDHVHLATQMHQGGIVPGRTGEDVLALLEAGETVTPRAGGAIRLHPDDIRAIADAAAAKTISVDRRVLGEVTTKAQRHAGRSLR